MTIHPTMDAPAGWDTYYVDGDAYMTYRIYEPAERKLTAKAINLKGNSISSIDDKSVTAGYGFDVSIVRADGGDDYTFLGWRTDKAATSDVSKLTTGSTYIKRNLTENTTVYAVYAANKTLTAKPIDMSGSSLSNIIDNVSATVGYGSRATVQRKTLTGWSFQGWKREKTDASYVTRTDTTKADYVSGSDTPASKFNVKSLTDNTTVFAVYMRDHFKGMASVFEGSSVSGKAAASTDWRDGNKDASASMECANAGCAATFQLKLETVKPDGAKYKGSTKYWTYKNSSKQLGGSVGLSISPDWEKTDGTGGTSVSESTGTLKPGGEMCQSIEFKPYTGKNKNGNSPDPSTVTEEACMSAKVTYFQGRVTVTGAASGNTGWKDENYSKNFYAENCTDGCKVSFKHELQRTSDKALGSTNWKVMRESNLITSTRAIAAGSVGSGTFNSNSATVATDNNNGSQYTLYPGMVLCERLTFKPNNDTTDVADDVTVSGCASAKGNAQPDDPNQKTEEPGGGVVWDYTSNDTSFLNIKVRNQNVARYSNFMKEVYAKPDDALTYRAVYNPILQYTYFLNPQKMQINGGTIYANSGTVPPGGESLGTMFNRYNGRPWWNNGFTVSGRGVSSGNCINYVQGPASSAGCRTETKSSYAPGNMTRKVEPNYHSVTDAEAGTDLNETAAINVNDSVSTTPRQVIFTNNSDSNLGNVLTTWPASDAHAYVPYNFETGAKVTTDENTVFYAGEKKFVDFEVSINKKVNTITTDNNGSYVTKADQVNRKLVVYNPKVATKRGGGIMYGGRNADVCSGYFGHGNDETGCGYSKDSTANLEAGAHSASEEIYAQDLSAGSEICVALAVFPATSGLDTNWSDLNYSNSWRISDSKCYTIAKRPSLQVWGGNIYTRGGINTSVAEKNSLARHNWIGYKVNQSMGTYIFGSWGELGVVAGGTVKGFSSGATLGFTYNSNGALWPNHEFRGNDNTTASYSGTGNAPRSNVRPGGSEKSSICDRSVLTFANAGGISALTSLGNCDNNSGVGRIGNAVSSSNATEDKASVKNKYLIGKNDYLVSDGVVRLGVDSKYRTRESKNSQDVYYYYGGNDLLIVGGQDVPRNTIQVVHTNDDVTITGDLIYKDSYSSFDDLPKLVIYAKNINIACGVNRVDALLVADKVVTTCSDSDNDDSRKNSRQLVVNGAVVADKVIPNRTYGAATGANSMIPAEIISFDPTLYLWGGDDSVEEGGNNMNLDVSYSKEVAPRE